MRRWLFLVLLAAALAFLQACGSSNSNPIPPPTPPPPAPQITITAPADGTTVTTLPTTITVTFSNGADPTTMKALLDGADVSAQFSAADSTGTRQVKVDRPQLNLGKNQIQVYAGTVSAGASFTVALSGLGATSASLPLLVPIQTRVLTGDGTHATDYNIALYTDPSNPTTPTLIPASTPSDGSNTGFQIVYLSRSNLSVVSNVTLPNPDLSGAGFSNTPLYNALTTTPSGCGTAGCLLIIQSLGTIGYAPCYYSTYNNPPLDCSTFYKVFTGLGGSNRVAYANGTINQVAYSFIGNTSPQGPVNNPAPAGTYYERLTCSATSPTLGTCDTLGEAPVTLAGTAPANATPAQIGNMSGALVRDNFLNFTYVQTAPSVAFSSGIDTQNVSAPNISHNFTINGTVYWSGFALGQNGEIGGIHVVILDRTTLALMQNQWWQAQSGASEVTAVSNFLNNFGSQNDLIFIAFFGDTHYDTSSTSVAMANRLIWFNMAGGTIPNLGGTEQVFYLMNNQEHAPPQQLDDYTLVGAFLDEFNTGLQQQTYAEMSSVISRETEANPQPSLMEGFLHMDHQGYYSPGSYTHQFGMAIPSVADAVSASRLSPTAWLFPSPDNNPPSSQAAYTWISQQLCCSDIRAAYVNQNVLPQLWLDELSQLSYSTAVSGSSQADFDAMKAQLTTEFEYVAAVRQLQANIRQMYNDQQSNVGLELQQAQDEVTASAQVALNTPAPSASWLGILGDVFGVVGAVGGFASVTNPEIPAIGPAIATAASLGTLATQIAANETNTAGGTSLQAEENINTTAGQMAGKAADEYARTLVQLGNQFDRVVTDWGRLKTLGAPLLANQLPWDSNASGLLLRSYNRVILREFYTKLLHSVAQVNYYPYTSDHAFSTDTFKPGKSVEAYCSYSTGNYNVDPYWGLATVPVLFYPSGTANTDTNPNDGHHTNYPYDYAWGTWGLVFNEHSSDLCPMSHTQPDTTQFGLFTPLDPNNPNSLGAYRLWFFTRKGYMPNTYNDVQPCYDGSGVCE